MAENQRQEKISKDARRGKSHFTYRRTRIKITVFFLSEIIQPNKEWSEIFKELKGKHHQPKILYPEKLFFRVKEK